MTSQDKALKRELERKGKKLLDSGDLQGALDLYDSILEEDPDSLFASLGKEYTEGLIKERNEIFNMDVGPKGLTDEETKKKILTMLGKD